MAKTLLDLIDKVDGFGYGTKSELFYDFVAHDGSTVIGYMSLQIAQHFVGVEGVTVDSNKRTVTIAADYNTIEKRNKLFAAIACEWKERTEFEEELKYGWRNELYTVYNPTSVPYMLIERAFSVLLGVVTYGVHIVGYVPPENSENGQLKLWVPRRAATKPTYPGMLDNTVAGGLGYPYGIWDTVVKECFEEAGLDEDLVKRCAKSAGVVLYMYYPESKIERVQPEIEYIYDLPFDNESIKPYPEDGEAEDFKLMELQEVMERLRNEEFKPNCGLVIIDFLIRHGYITPENEKDYLEIQVRCHRKVPFPTL